MKVSTGTLTNCARCGQDHKDLNILPFTQPTVISIGGAELRFTYWAMCPTVNEPIIIRVAEKDEPKEENP